LIYFLIALFFFIAIVFRYTSIVVEEFISEGVQEMANFSKMSQSLSAVTLLAFAGGAGELITA